MVEITEQEEISCFSISSIIGRSMRDVAEFLHIRHCFHCVKVKRRLHGCVYFYQRDFDSTRKIVLYTKGTAYTDEFVDKISIE